MPTSTGVNLPKMAFCHWFSSTYPTRLNNRVAGSANGSAGVTTTFGYVVPATSPGDGFYLNDYCDPADTTSAYNTVGGLLRNMPPLSRVMAFSSATSSIPVGPVGATWAGKTAPQWRLDDLVQEVADMVAAGYDGGTVEMLQINLAGATSVPAFYSFPGGGSDQWDRQVLMFMAADTYNAARGTSFKCMPMPDIATTGTTVASVVAALRTVWDFASSMKVVDGGVTKLIVAPYRPEVQPASFWVSVRDGMASAGKPIVMIPTFVNSADSAGGKNAWESAGIRWGDSEWGSRNPQANGPTSSTAKIASAATTPSGIWMQPVSLQDSRPRTRVYQESLGWGNLLATWALAQGGAYWTQQATWNDWSEHSGIAPSVALGALDVATLPATLAVPDPGYGAMISVPGLLARRYLRRWRDGAALPTDNTIWVCHRRHSYTAVPTWSGYTINTQIEAGTATSAQIGADTRMWRDLTRTLSGTTWSYNPNAGGSQPAANIVDVLTFFDNDTTVSVTVGGVQIGTTQTATAGEWRYSFPTGGLTGEVVVTASRAGSAPVTVTSPTQIVAAPLVQDMQYYPTVGVATFTTSGTGIQVVSPTNHNGNRIRNVGDPLIATDAATLGTVQTYSGTTLDAALAFLYAAQGGIAVGESTIWVQDATNSTLTMSSGVLLLTYFRAWKTETITQIKSFSGGTAAAGITLAKLGIYSVDATTGDLTLVASTANTTTLMNATSAEFTTALTTSFSKVRGQQYALGCLFVGTTPPAIPGTSVAIGQITDEGPRVSGQLTGQTDLPGSITAGTVTSNTRRQFAVLVP